MCALYLTYTSANVVISSFSMYLLIILIIMFAYFEYLLVIKAYIFCRLCLQGYPGSFGKFMIKSLNAWRSASVIVFFIINLFSFATRLYREYPTLKTAMTTRFVREYFLIAFLITMSARSCSFV